MKPKSSKASTAKNDQKTEDFLVKGMALIEFGRPHSPEKFMKNDFGGIWEVPREFDIKKA